MSLDSTTFRRAVLLAKYRSFRPSSLAYNDQLKRNESLSLAGLGALNWTKRQKIVEFAFRNCPFYRDRFQEVLGDRGCLRDPEQFSQLPILEKLDVRQHFAELVARSEPARYGALATTGGSTGEPLKTLRDTRVPVDVIQWRVFDWWGVPHHTHWGRVWRIPGNSQWSDFRESVKWWPSRMVRVDASSLDASKCLAFLRRLAAARCELLYGYVGGIEEMARVALQHDLQFPDLRAVWVTSAPLPESTRTTIASAFGAPVYNEYGSCEIMRIAVQARQDGPLRIHGDLRHVEIVDDEGRLVPDGTTGNILVTDLENRVFPMIRYRIGDRGMLLPRSDHPEDHPFPVMGPVLGRESETFRFPCGITVPGEFLTTLFDDHTHAISAFQVTLKKDFSVLIRYVPTGSSESVSTVLNRVQGQLGTRITERYPIRFEAVDSIPHDRGKLRFVRVET